MNKSFCGFLASFFKKRLYWCEALLGKHATNDLGLMVERIIIQIYYTSKSTCAEIGCAVNHTYDTRIDGCTRAHRARLERHVQIAADKPDRKSVV